MSKRTAIAFSFLLGVTACDGPAMKGGRQADHAAVMAAQQSRSIDLENMTVGLVDDRIEQADNIASEAAADAIEHRADQLRAEANLEADRLDERARKLRMAQK